MMTLAFELNGRQVVLDCAPELRLLALLREHFLLVGAKPGCEVGRCGACMVWLDGEPVPACLVMAWQLPGRRVTTIESVALDPASAPVRQALADAGAVQCGYCNGGMVMTLTYLHGRVPRPCRHEATALMCGNLCRCTGYGGVARAIEHLFDAEGDADADPNPV